MGGTLERRRGVVLATVLLLMIAVTLLAHGGMVLARSFRQGAVETWQAVRVRRAVVARIAAAAQRGDTAATGWLPAGPEVEVSLRPRRLSTESLLLTAAGRSAVARWWAGQVVWAPDPLTRARSLGAVVRVPRAVAASDAAQIQPYAGAGCLASAGGPLAPLAALAPGEFGVGPLGPDRLASLLTPWIPARGGSGVASGPLRLDGGLHQGVFLVRGDLVVATGAVVRGMLFVEGAVAVLDSARIEGAVQALTSLAVASTAAVRSDPCAVADAWAGAIALGLRPVAVDAHPWPLWGPPPWVPP